MKKNSLIVSLVIILIVFLIGGCRMKEKEILTKRQQDNVVKRITRDYDIQSIEFTELNKNQDTETYLLNIRINSNKKMETTIPLRTLDRLDNTSDSIGLNPVDNFKDIQRHQPLNDIDISEVKIIYLKQ